VNLLCWVRSIELASIGGTNSDCLVLDLFNAFTFMRQTGALLALENKWLLVRLKNFL
jgi:hypothetical protein